MSSILAPSRLAKPAVAASGRLSSSGCALLTISAARLTAALDGWPALAALPVNG